MIYFKLGGERKIFPKNDIVSLCPLPVSHSQLQWPACMWPHISPRVFLYHRMDTRYNRRVMIFVCAYIIRVTDCVVRLMALVALLK